MDLASRAGADLELFLCSELFLFSMSLLQAVQLLLGLATDVTDVSKILLGLLQLHLHLGQLLLKVVQLHTDGLAPCLGTLQQQCA